MDGEGKGSHAILGFFRNKAEIVNCVLKIE